MCLIDQLHSGCFENLNRVGNVRDCLFVIVLCQFLLRIYILIVVKFHFLQDRI